jgi:hypothetical protein
MSSIPCRLEEYLHAQTFKDMTGLSTGAQNKANVSLVLEAELRRFCSADNSRVTQRVARCKCRHKISGFSGIGFASRCRRVAV